MMIYINTQRSNRHMADRYTIDTYMMTPIGRWWSWLTKWSYIIDKCTMIRMDGQRIEI